MIIGIVSGYFNPLHYGHVEYMNAAKKFTDKLICIVNSDHQVTLKGTKRFMDEKHRSDIVLNLKAVDEVFISVDRDGTVCESLRCIRNKHPTNKIIFFNSGDRKGNNLNSKESIICKEIGIELQILDLPKIYSSTDLLKQ